MKWNYGLRVKAILADWTARDSHKLCSEKDAFDRDIFMQLLFSNLGVLGFWGFGVSWLW